MRLLLIILFSFSVNAITLDKIKASRLQVNRYIIPQMNSILKDFAHLENSMNQNHKYIKQTRIELIKLKKLLSEKKFDQINKQNKEVYESLVTLRAATNKKSIDKLSHLITSLKSNFLYLNNCRSFNTDCKEQARENYLTEIEGIIAYIHTVRYDFFPAEFKEEFQIIWNEFFKKIYYIKNDHFQIKTMENYLVQLNYSWHEFNKYMHIREKKLSGDTNKYLKYIDNRWKSILKTAL